MRRKTAAVGVLLLIVALYLYFNPSLTSPISSSLGQMGTDTVFDRNSVITVAPQSFSHYETNLTAGDTLVVSLMANPGNIDVLLMNQGNFSLWSSASGVSYSTYTESALKVSNYSFSFTNNEKSQNFFVVFVSHSSTEPTDVLVHAMATRPSQGSLLLFPVILGLVGIIVLGVAFRGGGAKKQEAEEAPPPSRPMQSSQTPTCRHCGAALRPGSQFCPSCNRSQL